MQVSSKTEKIFVSVVAATTAIEGYVVASAIPENIKLLVVPVLTVWNVGAMAFWAQWINPK